MAAREVNCGIVATSGTAQMCTSSRPRDGYSAGAGQMEIIITVSNSIPLDKRQHCRRRNVPHNRPANAAFVRSPTLFGLMENT